MKIALVGSAPGSVGLAPYRDHSWEIWACSPAVAGLNPPISVHFELHPFAPGSDSFPAGYVSWLRDFANPVYMQAIETSVPSSRPYPFEQMRAKYGDNFFTSSIAWMFALALEQDGVTEIGLWGIDMAAESEWAAQKPALLRFVEIARERKITVTVPGESDLLQPPPLYGLWEATPIGRKLKVRKQELLSALAGAQQDREQADTRVKNLEGALDDLNYFARTWAR